MYVERQSFMKYISFIFYLSYSCLFGGSEENQHCNGTHSFAFNFATSFNANLKFIHILRDSLILRIEAIICIPLCYNLQLVFYYPLIHILTIKINF